MDTVCCGQKYYRPIDIYQQNLLTDATIQKHPLTAKKTFEFQLHKLILITPTIQKAIKENPLPTRDKLTTTIDEFDIKKLNDEQVELFKKTWCETTLLSIENKELRFPPFKKPG